MAATSSPRGPKDKGLPTLAGELWELVLAYLKQETVVPVRGLARFVALGMAGAAVLSVGLVLLVVGLLRALQTETDGAFSGNLSWAPYLITLLAAATAAGLAARAVGGHRRRARRRQVAR